MRAEVGAAKSAQLLPEKAQKIAYMTPLLRSTIYESSSWRPGFNKSSHPRAARVQMSPPLVALSSTGAVTLGWRISGKRVHPLGCGGAVAQLNQGIFASTISLQGPIVGLA
jgi:hypothetical protein